MYSVDTSNSDQVTPLHLRLRPKLPLTDKEFYSSFLSNKLSNWGHDTKIRLIYLLLQDSNLHQNFENWY